MAHRKTRHTVKNLPFSVQKRDGTSLPAETRRIRYNNAASEMSEGFERGVGMHPYSPLSVLARTRVALSTTRSVERPTITFAPPGSSHHQPHICNYHIGNAHEPLFLARGNRTSDKPYPLPYPSFGETSHYFVRLVYLRLVVDAFLGCRLALSMLMPWRIFRV